MGTDFGLRFQGISNSSSSECNIYLGNYEKSLTMFFSQLSSWARSGPSAGSPLTANRGALCHLAAKVLASRARLAPASSTPAPRGPGRVGRVGRVGPGGTRVGPGGTHPATAAGTPRTAWRSRDGGADENSVWLGALDNFQLILFHFSVGGRGWGVRGRVANDPCFAWD